MLKKRGPPWAPKPQDYNQVFQEQNPWHLDGKVPDAWARPAERPLAKLLWQRLLANEPRRFQLVLGQRRVGKTTSLYQTVKRLLAAGIAARRLWWLRLDHPLLMQIPLGELGRHVLNAGRATPTQPVFLFLDELTYADKWDLWLKTFYDETWPLCVAGSSSSTAALRHRQLESGVGRWEEQYLAPHLFTEYLDLLGRSVPVPVEPDLAATVTACLDTDIAIDSLPDLRRRFLLTGGFPELLLAHADPPSDERTLLLQSQRTLHNEAVERAIYKDIPQVFGVENPMLLERMLYTLAGQVTGVLAPNTLCQALAGMSQPTFDRYLSYLQRAFLVFTLPNYSGSEASVQKRGRKLYFVDGAVRNAALQRGLSPLSDPGEMGLLLENLVAGHLYALSQLSQVRLYHWRDKDDEVDLIYDHPEHPMAFEIGCSTSHHRRGLIAFLSRFPHFRGAAYLVSPGVPAGHPRAYGDQIGTVPLDLFLLAVSAMAERALATNLAVKGEGSGGN
jgi:uncharacterized protein